MHALRGVTREAFEPLGTGPGEQAPHASQEPQRVRGSRIGRLAARAILRVCPFPDKPEARLAAAAIEQAITDAHDPGYRIEVLRFLRGPALGWLALLGIESDYATELLERAGIQVRAPRWLGPTAPRLLGR